MSPEHISKIALSRCREGFLPKYLLETEMAATSLVKKAWIFNEGKWDEISTDFSDVVRVKEMAYSAKMKYFIKGNDLHCFVNDPVVRYFDQFIVSLSEPP